MPEDSQFLFQHSTVQSDKRLRELGIGVHTPAINGIMDTLSDGMGNQPIEQALLKQRKATSAKKLKGILNVNVRNNATKQEQGGEHPLEQHKVHITQLDYKSPSRWNKKIRTVVSVLEPPPEPEQSAERKLVCIECKALIDVKQKQLHVKDGHRVLHCPR